jgi:uncharacterized UPF0160 family protein
MTINKIVTHSERFHCDEVCATALLQLIYPNITVHRTRDPSELKKAQQDPSTLVIDVGHIYDHNSQCYDHHQESFAECRVTNIPLSSFGLIYKHYGCEFLRIIAENIKFDLDDDLMTEIYDKFYKQFVLSIDAGDNGIEFCRKSDLVYTPIILPITVSNMNNENVRDEHGQMTCFMNAVELCQQHILIYAKSIIQKVSNYHTELAVFQDGLKHTSEALKQGGILLLAKSINVRTYLEEYDPDQNIKFIIVPRDLDKDIWNIWTVNVKGSVFETLCPIISEDEARILCGNNVVFIHKKHFTGAVKNVKNAITIAQESVLQAKELELELNSILINLGNVNIFYNRQGNLINVMIGTFAAVLAYNNNEKTPEIVALSALTIGVCYTIDIIRDWILRSYT